MTDSELWELEWRGGHEMRRPTLDGFEHFSTVIWNGVTCVGPGNLPALVLAVLLGPGQPAEDGAACEIRRPS